MLSFNADVTRLLEDAYQGSDVTHRRLVVLQALAPKAGDRVLDIGCGPGLLALDLSRMVGPAGAVVGIDPSPDMLQAARKRCDERGNVRILEGSANTLPVADEAFDAAVSLQVFEYLDDIPGALAEAGRKLVPGGRVVIGDVHWDSLVWHSDDAVRMARLIAAWDRHLAERRVPAILPSLLEAAGFVVEAVTPVAIHDRTLRPDGIAEMLVHLVEAYAVQNELVQASEAAAWAVEQRELAAEGRFFFSLIHFVTRARWLG